MNTITPTYVLVDDRFTPDVVQAVYDGIVDTGIKTILGFSDGMFILLNDAVVIELDIANAQAVAVNLVSFGYDGPANMIAKILANIAKVHDPAESPRWDATISGTCTHGNQFSGSFEIDEVSELQDIIEKGPCFGPGYKVNIELTYAL